MTTISQERTRLSNVGMRHRRREQWGSTFNYTTARAVNEPATRVFIHITVTNPGNYNSFDAHARAIEAIGRSRFPATGISYNRLFMAGTRAIYEAQPTGRRGAHTVNDFKRSTCSIGACPGRGSSLTAPSWNLNYNARAYAICQNVGHSVPDHMVEDIARAIVADHRAGFLTRSAVENIHGHRCVSSKSCPGDRMWSRMAAVQSRINALLSGGTTPPPPPPPPKDDDMPYRDWPQADKNALVDDVAAAVWRRDNPQTDTHYGVLLSRLYRRYYEAQPRLGQPETQWHGMRYIRDLDRVLRVVLAQLETASAERAVVRELVGELVARGPSSLTVEDLDAAVERGMQRHRVELQVKLLELEAAEQEEPDDPDEES